MKWIHSAIWIVMIFSISSSFAQSIATSGTPSQGGFEAGIVQTTPITETPSQGAFRVDLNQTTPVTETPSQGAFDAGNLQASNGTSTAKYNVTISKVIKEADALHVIVANNGTTSANLKGWKLTLNNGTNTYTLPNFTLQSGAVVTVHTHMNANTPTDIYGSNFMWNGTRDVELFDDKGKLMTEYTINTSLMNTSAT